jgi:Na+-transporting NADH:ubiquinone oxidoreductase subunit F
VTSPARTVHIDINDRRKVVDVPPGRSLLSTLAGQAVFLSSACGGNANCATCKCTVLAGGGHRLPAEEGHIDEEMARQGLRLACQLKVENDLKIRIPDAAFAARKLECTVRSNRNVATFIKELVLDLPAGMPLNFRAGGYVQIDAPPYEIAFRDFEIDEPYRDAWTRDKLLDTTARNEMPAFRAYSMANHPAEGNVIMLNVRIVMPPGKVSTYIFNLKPGDKVWATGPFGEFFAKESTREMVYLGGGAGMAPLRSHIFDLFQTKKTGRKVSYWYGARSRRDLFYEEDFRAIEKSHANFRFNVALSEPEAKENWTGHKGPIHQVVLSEYLKKHEDPKQIEYYLCGPPPMIAAANMMLFGLRVKREMIAYDEF